MYNSKEEALLRNLWNSDRSFQISISDWATFHGFHSERNDGNCKFSHNRRELNYND